MLDFLTISILQYAPVSDEVIPVGNEIEVELPGDFNLPEPHVDPPDINFEPEQNVHDHVSVEVRKLKLEIAQKDQKIAYYQRLYWNARKSVKHYKLRIAKKEKGIMPKKQKKQIAKEVLKATGKLSDAKLRVLVDGKKFAKNLPATDLATALQLRNISKKAYKFMNSILPIFPHLDTLRKKFSFLRIMPGVIIKPVMMYLEHLVSTLGPDNIELLAAIGFDEVGLLNLAEIDPRFDNIIGECTNHKC